MPPTVDALLSSLEASRSHYGRGATSEITALLDRLSRHQFRDAKSLLRLHEALLFLRAFPQSAAVIPPLERLLNTFHARIATLRELGVDMSAFDEFDTSGIAGTTMQDALNFEAARWLARRIPRSVEIAWEDYEEERAMGSTWPRFVPLLSEDADVEANIPWRSWIDAARGRERDLEWLIRRFEQLGISERERAELYDSLRLPLRWDLKNLKFSRTRNWTRPRRFYYHNEALIVRSQVSLAQELAQTAPRLVKLSHREGESVMDLIREVMAVRYRELYGTTLGDPGSVVCATLDRGVVMYFWNLHASRRLPLRAYVAGFTLKNGVPINYIEAIGLCEWIEVGFNTFYTYRQGETAWIYAQALRCLCAFTGATTISVYPYQIGQQNDEALDSGAFWFYRKLGFRSGSKALEKLARKEEKKITANAKYRSSRTMLKQLAEAHVFYEVEAPSAAKAAIKQAALTARLEVVPFPKQALRRQAFPAASSRQASFSGASFIGAWDKFSTRHLGLRVNRRMAREFGGDSERMRRASVAAVSRALDVSLTRWNSEEQQAFGNWSLVLALLPDLGRWTAKEKRGVVEIIRAQAGANEMRYLRLTQEHPRLRGEMLRLGSKR